MEDLDKKRLHLEMKKTSKETSGLTRIAHKFRTITRLGGHDK